MLRRGLDDAFSLPLSFLQTVTQGMSERWNSWSENSESWWIVGIRILSKWGIVYSYRNLIRICPFTAVYTSYILQYKNNNH